MGIPAKIVKTCDKTEIAKICDKTGEISARIGRTFKETAAIFGKTTETCEQTVRICGKTRGPCVMTASKCGRMNTLEPALDNSNRTGNRCGTTVKISRAIVGMYEPIARTGEAIVRISEKTGGIGIRIGRTFKETVRIGEPISMSPVVARNNGQAIVDKPRFATRKR
jgi:hypothetical protein